MPISPARSAAFEILRRVEQEGAYSSALLAATDGNLNPKDRALCHDLVLGTLRRRLWLHRALEQFAKRPIEKFDLPVTVALRFGLYQLRFLSRMPASAAVNESVELVRAARLASAASFVNAVLRRATREPNYDPSAAVTNEIDKISIETSHPAWLVERWSDQFGREEAAALARANNQPAPLAFRFTARALGNSDRALERIIDELTMAGAELIESKVAAGAWRFIPRESAGTDAGKSQPESVPASRTDSVWRGGTGVPPANHAQDARATLKLYPAAQLPPDGNQLAQALAKEGVIFFQDEASQMVAHVLGAKDGLRVLDVCAAPGGKSTLIAYLAPGAHSVAGDIYEHRVRTVRQLAAQQATKNIHLLVHDATQDLPFSDSAFDRVLVDAPCSGTGTLRHNPEIRWRLKPSDISELATKQRAILRNAAAKLRAGGLIVYSTCSVERDENEAVVNDFLNEHPEFQRAAPKAPATLITTDGYVRTWAHRDDVDGFFVTALQRQR